jgi:predicted nuclease with TOPRIM domain
MADEPENLTLKLLREMRADITGLRDDMKEVRAEQAAVREDLKEIRAEQHALASLLGKVSDAVTAIAATQEHHSQVLARHSELFGQVIETQQSHGGRLNAIESRLAIIEKHTGLVKA